MYSLFAINTLYGTANVWFNLCYIEQRRFIALSGGQSLLSVSVEPHTDEHIYCHILFAGNRSTICPSLRANFYCWPWRLLLKAAHEEGQELCISWATAPICVTFYVLPVQAGTFTRSKFPTPHFGNIFFVKKFWSMGSSVRGITDNLFPSKGTTPVEACFMIPLNQYENGYWRTVDLAVVVCHGQGANRRGISEVWWYAMDFINLTLWLVLPIVRPNTHDWF